MAVHRTRGYSPSSSYNSSCTCSRVSIIRSWISKSIRPELKRLHVYGVRDHAPNPFCNPIVPSIRFAPVNENMFIPPRLTPQFATSLACLR